MTSPRAVYLPLVIELLRRRRLIVVVGLLVGVTTVVLGLLGPRSYTSSASFFPRARRPVAAASGLAAQLGLSLPNSDVTEGAAFFDLLLRTREVLDSALLTTYRFPADTGPVSADLLTLLKVKGDSARRLAMGRKTLRTAIRTYIDYKSGVISLEVRAYNPQLALLLSERLLGLLDQYNRKTRRSQATAEREFSEERLGQVKGELREAEDQLEVFLSRNREYRSSAQLTFQQERLQREVNLRQQIYSTLAQAYEQARLEEVRDTPVLTIVQPARVPEMPDGRGLAVKGILATMLGAVLACVTILFGLQMRLLKEREPDGFGDLSQLRREVLSDLRRPWRLLGLGR